MGDRINVYFRPQHWRKTTPNEPVVAFYSHWRGSDVDTWLAEALRHAKARWNDDAYATRMIISYALKDELLEEYSYGIYAIDIKNISLEENGFRVVDFNNNTVWGKYSSNEDFVPVSFEDYVKNQLID